MQQEAILAPMLGLMVLTLFVWIYMYALRLGYIARQGVNPQDLATPDRRAAVLPERINLPAHNLRNLFELPVAFYALCLYLYVTGSVDGRYVVAAWLFVALRAVHSVIHCTCNRVTWRFSAYMLGALTLWVMLGMAVLAAVGID